MHSLLMQDTSAMICFVESKYKRTLYCGRNNGWDNMRGINVEFIFYCKARTEMKMGPSIGEGIVQRNRKRMGVVSYPGFVFWISGDVNNPLIRCVGLQFLYDRDRREAEGSPWLLPELCALCCELGARHVDLCCK